MTFYGPALARIHDEGHADFVDGVMPGVLSLLPDAGVCQGRVLDLGCGAGQSSAALHRAGYDVWGLDRSAAMVRRARQRARGATFRVGSVVHAALPAADVAIAIGEVFNYLSGPVQLRQAFARVGRALHPGGLLLFDLAVIGRGGGRRLRQVAREGRGWAVLSRIEEDRTGGRLVRRITAFEKRRGSWRRSTEVHRQRLYRASEVAGWLRAAGFTASVRRGYGAALLDANHRVLLARRC